MGHRARIKPRLLAQALAHRFSVYTFDLRGHGESAGACTGGALEHLDVDAVVSLARREGATRVVTLGWSLGGIAVVRHAAEFGGVDGVVAISAPADWDAQSAAVRRATWLFTTKVGRLLAWHIAGTKIKMHDPMPDPPELIVPRIKDTPILIIHGTDDHFFGSDAGRRIFAAARDPKKLIEHAPFGHAEDGFTPAFAALLINEIESMVPVLTG